MRRLARLARLARLHLLWIRQGRPRRFPVVIEEGRLLILPSGQMLICDWTIWEEKMDEVLVFDGSGTGDDIALWEYLTRFAEPEWVKEET